AHVQLPALAVGLRGDGLPRHAVARLRPPPPLARLRDLRLPRPPLRRCRAQSCVRWPGAWGRLTTRARPTTPDCGGGPAASGGGSLGVGVAAAIAPVAAVRLWCLVWKAALWSPVAGQVPVRSRRPGRRVVRRHPR